MTVQAAELSCGGRRVLDEVALVEFTFASAADSFGSDTRWPVSSSLDVSSAASWATSGQLWSPCPT